MFCLAGRSQLGKGTAWTHADRVLKAMWLIKSFKSELLSNVILVSNFCRIAFHKKEIAWSPSIWKQKREDVHLKCTLRNNLKVACRWLVKVTADTKSNRKRLKKVFLLCSTYLFWHAQCSSGCIAMMWNECSFMIRHPQNIWRVRS